MSNVTTALVLASEAAEGSSAPSPYLFGAVALVVLLVLLGITMMIKVGD